MKKESIREILERVRNGDLDIDGATAELCSAGYVDVGHTKVDIGRERRTGAPEVVYCEGKRTGEILDIVSMLHEHGSNVLATRASQEVFEAVKSRFAAATYNGRARTISVVQSPPPPTDSYIAIVTAGTADLPVAEEAVETATFFGNRVMLIADVGVAGIHRLFDHIDIIRGARVVVAVAGMEGALASVVAGLVDVPVIAVPTSVGYGASLGGLAALLAMLNSCAGGVGVVNIDNGFGAGYLASMINHIG
jgi:NCAIR mutase (PurE)-related protein